MGYPRLQINEHQILFLGRWKWFEGPRKCDIDLILERHSQCRKFAENICNRISQLPISCRLYGDPSYVGPIDKLSQILFIEENRHKNFFFGKKKKKKKKKSKKFFLEKKKKKKKKKK